MKISKIALAKAKELVNSSIENKTDLFIYNPQEKYKFASCEYGIYKDQKGEVIEKLSPNFLGEKVNNFGIVLPKGIDSLNDRIEWGKTHLTKFEFLNKFNEKQSNHLLKEQGYDIVPNEDGEVQRQEDDLYFYPANGGTPYKLQLWRYPIFNSEYIPLYYDQEKPYKFKHELKVGSLILNNGEILIVEDSVEETKPIENVEQVEDIKTSGYVEVVEESVEEKPKKKAVKKTSTKKPAAKKVAKPKTEKKETTKKTTTKKSTTKTTAKKTTKKK